MDEDGIKYVLAQFVDIHGTAKVKMVPSSYLDDIVESGAGFAGAAVWGMGQGPHSHDVLGRADLETYTPLPWEPGVARFACDMYVDGAPHPFCPRVNLKRKIADLKALGYVFHAGIEPEFFLVKRLADGSIAIADDAGIDTLDKACYDFKGISQHMGLLRDLNDYMLKLDWGNYQTDHEDANGQYEINYTYSDALTAADRHTFIKMLTSQLARKYGYIATHMAKPFGNLTGSGAHCHFSLTDAGTGQNVFKSNGRDPYGIGQSELAYHFVGGVLKHASALCAVSSPTVNCYKRLQIGSALVGNRSGATWTPAFITYGDNNRTQMLRTPAPGRFEDRTVSAAHNPYLVMAAYIAAGIDGIVNKIDPGAPNVGRNMYEATEEELTKYRILPQSLAEAIEHLKRDEVIQEALGAIYPEFVKVKQAEWKEYHRTVSQWEIDRYLTLF
jgi:glutamine synthetase